MKLNHSQSIISESPEATREFAAALAHTLKPGTVLALTGDLGAGKTCFVQGLAHGLNVTQPVSSPTYTLVNEYSGDLPLYHIDLYRLRGTVDALGMGLDDYLESDGITAIEWPDRAATALPFETLRVRIEHGEAEHQRIITVGDAT